MMPTTIDATTSAAMPILIVHLSSPMPKAPAAADMTTSTIPAATMRLALGVTPRSVSSHGAPR